jgi:hypothetical protein
MSEDLGYLCRLQLEGIEKLHPPHAVETLPALVNLSLFLFLARLSVFLFNLMTPQIHIVTLCPRHSHNLTRT